jgi:hypothetical protein
MFFKKGSWIRGFKGSSETNPKNSTNSTNQFNVRFPSSTAHSRSAMADSPSPDLYSLDNYHIYAKVYFTNLLAPENWRLDMGQVTIYIDDHTEKKMLNIIEKSGLSKSKWIAELIREKTATTWPEDVVRLAGGVEGSADRRGNQR